MEDLVEEIVGDINDEYDVEQLPLQEETHPRGPVEEAAGVHHRGLRRANRRGAAGL